MAKKVKKSNNKKNLLKNIKSGMSKATDIVSKGIKKGKGKRIKTLVNKFADSGINNIVKIENGKPEINVLEALKLVTKLPGAKIDREKFLRKELSPNHKKSIVDDAINNNPAHAGIKISEINKIADSIIKYERNKVSALSFASGLPGGFMMVPAISMDVVQYFRMRSITDTRELTMNYGSLYENYCVLFHSR